MSALLRVEVPIGQIIHTPIEPSTGGNLSSLGRLIGAPSVTVGEYNVTTSERQPQRRAPVRMQRRERITLGLAGLASWIAGGVATFTESAGSGAVALIAAGVAAGILGLLGHWPSRVVVSGHELSWDEVVETVDDQIDAARDAGESAAVKELEDLRMRLAEAQRTGHFPMHPAAEYDEALRAAIRRVLPGLPLSVQPLRARDRADFELRVGAGRLLVESKFKLDPARPFRGSTLGPLLALVKRDDERLLVVTNALDVVSAQGEVQQTIGARGRVVSWVGPKDDDALRAAVDDLLR